MSSALAVYHGRFGRATLYRLDKPLATHTHREGHLIFRIGGSAARAIVSDKVHDLTRATAVAINPWQLHCFEPGDCDEGTVCLVLYINPAWFLEVGRNAQGALRFGRNEIKITEQIERLMHLLVASLTAEDGFALFDGYLYELTRCCYDQSWQWVSGEPDSRGLWTGVRDFRIRNSMKLMRQQLCDELDLNWVAAESGLSRPHFYKLFRQNIGVTPNIYLNTLRMEVSIERLSTTADPVTAIGLDLGFSSQASFTRFFTANVGIPPTDYRRATYLLH
jgi:AraC-like DNA-binding protein